MLCGFDIPFENVATCENIPATESFKWDVKWVEIGKQQTNATP